MTKGSDELLESALRLARAVGKAAARELPAMRRAAERMVRDELPRAVREAGRRRR